MEKRWYDKDPIVKLAVSLMEQSDDNIRNHVADYIIEEAKSMGLSIDENNFDCFWERWQDKNMKYFEAMEYLRIIDFETKKELSIEIIDYINSFKKEK